MKKCPQCGNDIPFSSKNCGHCGYSSESINHNYAYGNTGKNNNKLSGGNIALIIILCIFFGPVLFGIVAMVILFFSANVINRVVEEFPDYEEEPCFYICEEEDYREDANACYCSNGEIYDKEGNSKYYDTSNIHLSPLSINGWKTDILKKQNVVTVLCESDDYSCEIYIPIIYDSALRNGYILYIFDVDKLSDADKEYLFNIDLLGSFNNYYPFTFVSNGNEMISSRSGLMYENSLESFLEMSNVIGESY